MIRVLMSELPTNVSASESSTISAVLSDQTNASSKAPSSVIARKTVLHLALTVVYTRVSPNPDEEVDEQIDAHFVPSIERQVAFLRYLLQWDRVRSDSRPIHVCQ